MGFHVPGVPPLGRGLRDYEAMFSLDEAYRTKRIISCADGAASFNAEWTAAGGKVVSVDPLYEQAIEEIERRFRGALDVVMNQMPDKKHELVWKYYQSPDEYQKVRLQSFELFKKDFQAGREAGRYKDGELPWLDFQDGEFDLALCSHFLFLYSSREEFGEEFHLSSISELCRIARTVCVFPLVDLNMQKSSFVASVVRWAKELGLRSERIATKYELQKGGNECLRITRQAE